MSASQIAAALKQADTTRRLNAEVYIELGFAPSARAAKHDLASMLELHDPRIDECRVDTLLERMAGGGETTADRIQVACGIFDRYRVRELPEFKRAALVAVLLWSAG